MSLFLIFKIYVAIGILLGIVVAVWAIKNPEKVDTIIEEEILDDEITELKRWHYLLVIIGAVIVISLIWPYHMWTIIRGAFSKS